MALKRQQAFYGQQRLDVPHLRAIESAVAADFDVLGGRVLTGQRAMIIRGFTIVDPDQKINDSPSTLQMAVASGMLINPLASEAGSFFNVDDDADPETLSSTNDKVDGSFTASATNYVCVDLRRELDDSTSDTVAFIDANSDQETPQTVALARTINLRIVITTTDPSLLTHLCPVAVVTTDSSNLITGIADARPLMFRLGSGGSAPDPTSSFTWADGRDDGDDDSATAFTGGDRAIRSEKDWKDAVMTRLWELGGGERWFSGTTDRELKLCFGDPPLSNGDNFDWDLPTETLEWASLQVIFANSTGTVNEIADGDEVLADGECLYVDIDRTQDLTGGSALIPQVGEWQTLGQPSVPGSRVVIAWRIGDQIFARERDFEVGRLFTVVASTTVSGTVKLNAVAGAPTDPVVISVQANGTASNTATGGNAAGFTGTGNGSGAGVQGTGGATANAPGLKGLGGTTGRGGDFTGGSASGIGVTATGLAAGAAAVSAVATSAAHGIVSAGAGGGFNTGTGFALGFDYFASALGSLIDGSGSDACYRSQVRSNGTIIPDAPGGKGTAWYARSSVNTAVHGGVAWFAHARAAGAQDAVGLWSVKNGDGDVDLHFGTSFAGSVVPQIIMDSSAAALVPSSSGGWQLGYDNGTAWKSLTVSEDPAVSTDVKNRVTAKNLIKSWCYLEIDPSDNVSPITILDGFNVDSAGLINTAGGPDQSAGAYLQVNWGQAFATANYGVSCTVESVDHVAGGTAEVSNYHMEPLRSDSGTPALDKDGNKCNFILYNEAGSAQVIGSVAAPRIFYVYIEAVGAQ